ncbi:DNA topoisomerase 2-associated protein PAT1 [Sporothrix schenckii 1099-18]|uniref:DNA topoisomerase 2-associated protein PAT1 n=1 Tax=Sporothrix schenckii 1099-18 TaxID=1397361 RepID=A0A0F2M5F3_SPOSC|nr:DNA topoisomerase 2-associated protein PAT1 [Sporothrix schenckii 1099-18]KJR84334.1 DNA topoisomerase 2-associated protein PAT1 [Sporothrix schenckii 1099-18]
MAFFGFDQSSQSRHNTAAPGFSQINDPFAGLASGNAVDDALEFEDTYDGLGDQLEETGDAFNDDTFGGDAVLGGASGGASGGGGNTGAFGSAKVGNDFDFFGQTAKVSDAIEEEHARFNRMQPVARNAPVRNDYTQGPSVGSYNQNYFAPAPAVKPVRSGYEKYKEPEPDMQVDAALWGVAPKKPAASSTPQASSTTSQTAPSGRKILSLEEVEAAMRNQSKAQEAPPVQPQQQPQQQQPIYQQIPEQYHQPPPGDYYPVPPQELLGDPSQLHSLNHPMALLQRPPAQQTSPGMFPNPQQQQQQQQQQHLQHRQAPPAQPTQILQNPNRLSEQFGAPPPQQFPNQPSHHRQTSSFSGVPHIITHPSQLVHLSDEEKAAYLEQEARRAKRNHKIFLLSKNNGLMTPQDKNFVTRIQLQQLVSATGNPNEHGTDEALREDFYYQVLNQIRGGNRQHPGQPLNNFAQTYLFQTGSRFNSRRYMNRDRGADNHMQRMEQQVQRAVEAAKNRPKNKQLVIEGTLGKISFSNAKTPKPLLNIKRSSEAAAAGGGSGSSGAEGGGGGSGSVGADRPASAHHKVSQSTSGHARVLDRKTVLNSIEKVYATLMEIEDHARSIPPPPTEQDDLELMQRRGEWAEQLEVLKTQLWRELKVHEPIGEFPVHPFIAFLSFPKGKKAIPRVFRHLSDELRATVLTMIVVHLDQLDIVRNAQVTSDSDEGTGPNAALREEIELFTLTVVHTLFTFMSELQLDLVAGVLGLITNLKVDVVARSRIGASMLTTILSRAELIKQAGGGTPEQWQSWEMTYNNFFNALEPVLPYMFPGTVSSGEDMYVWQLLAALGIGATPDQQQRLVLAVKDRVMDTVAVAKTLPVDLSAQRLQNVNLFMRSIGLDVELLQ